MVWRYTSIRHNLAIHSLVRTWIGGGMLTRWFMVSVPGVVWGWFWLFVGAGTGTIWSLFFLVVVAAFPWWFWLYDAQRDSANTNHDLNELLFNDDVVLATRCEYVGGHPLLPHGRFAYLVIEGTQQDPRLTILFPAQESVPFHRFAMPILDLINAKPAQTRAMEGDMSAIIRETPGGFLQPQRVTLVIEYTSDAGRQQKVEFTHFFRGDNEIRNWRNYLVCAQAEAETDKKPYGPWKSLRKVINYEALKYDATRDGAGEQPQGSAFPRR